MEGDINNPNFYSQLRDRLEEMEKKWFEPKPFVLRVDARFSSGPSH